MDLFALWRATSVFDMKAIFELWHKLLIGHPVVDVGGYIGMTRGE